MKRKQVRQRASEHGAKNRQENRNKPNNGQRKSNRDQQANANSSAPSAAISATGSASTSATRSATKSASTPDKKQHAAKGKRKAAKSTSEVGVYAKNELVSVQIVGLTHDGDGVGRTDKGYTLFVPQALPGEVAQAKVLKSKKQYGFGKLVSLESVSEHRVEPPCPIYFQCGGCQLQHFDYEAQLKWKRQHVIDSLTRIGKLNVQGEPASQAHVQHEVIVHPTIGMSDPWYYRNKAALPIGASPENGELIGGFYAKGSHRIIDMDVCLIQKELNDKVIAVAKDIARELKIEAYDEESSTGVLRHIMTRVGVITGEVMVVLITNTKTLPRKEEWIAKLREHVPNLKSVVHNVNNKVTNAIFGERTEVVWGSEVIYDELDGLRFAISARSFYQVNPEQTVALYRKAVEYAALTGKEQVIDAYCGIGTISLFLARHAAQVYGVEIVPEAIEDAKRNAALNQLTNTTFEAGPAEVVIPRWKQEGMAADVIVVDPPRKGCDPALLETILEIRPARVVYVSCNPSTLARDLRVLEDGGYRTVEVTPVDMFPQTGHVEVVTWLERV